MATMATPFFEYRQPNPMLLFAVARYLMLRLYGGDASADGITDAISDISPLCSLRRYEPLRGIPF